jgi:RIO kinase 1
MVIDKKIRRMDEKIDEFRMRIKDSERRDVHADVFDDATLMALYELSRKGYIHALGGSFNAGKEANLFHAIAKKDEIYEIAVKIYLISTANFNDMKEYILGDPQFIGIKQTRKDIILAWTKKEFKNLKRAEEAGVRVPKPYITKRNILLMEFIGKDGVPMPQPTDVKLTPQEASNIFNRIIEYMKLLYSKANLVHADLNILVDVNIMEPVIIDMGQSVTTDHLDADTYLRRDAANIARFFGKLDIPVNDDKIISIIKRKQNDGAYQSTT